MLKRIIILSSILTIAGCSSKQSQCDPEKNYVKSNPELVSEYFKLESEGKIKSIYYENANPERCNWDSCLYFDNKKFDFIEKNFSDEFHSGLYKVSISQKEKGKINDKCLEHDPSAYGLVDKCFHLEKINKISSLYSKKSEYRKDGFTIKMFKKEEMVFEYHGQFYSTKAIGAFGGGICEVKSYNQNFNVFSMGQ